MAPTALVLPTQPTFDSSNFFEGCSYPVSEWNLASVPPGWPLAVQSPLAWTGERLGPDMSYTYVLNEDEKKEIDYALHRFQGSQAPIVEALSRQLTFDSHGFIWKRSQCTKLPAPDASSPAS